MTSQWRQHSAQLEPVVLLLEVATSVPRTLARRTPISAQLRDDDVLFPVSGTWALQAFQTSVRLARVALRGPVRPVPTRCGMNLHPHARVVEIYAMLHNH
ncbi:hypothetical protein EXIGLDRAFT_303724 [Exidia glandulosa HHB12029]|uniref:Uncharacterized protein n=1 Tax=Exidia glandulosa HHB12029 TaxID=1314781 RepID=A0A165D6K0_EXIGL|nr:hypothetical protein EXIGLDRAFT_303724 [Exidia glandulosa HHB12029]